jgi:hypothetical protein
MKNGEFKIRRLTFSDHGLDYGTSVNRSVSPGAALVGFAATPRLAHSTLSNSKSGGKAVVPGYSSSDPVTTANRCPAELSSMPAR